jgi:hypothetical protein
VVGGMVNFLKETDFYRYLDEILERIRMYAKFDTEQMAGDMEIGVVCG